jgi:hypothetical protein
MSRQLNCWFLTFDKKTNYSPVFVLFSDPLQTCIIDVENYKVEFLFSMLCTACHIPSSCIHKVGKPTGYNISMDTFVNLQEPSALSIQLRKRAI